MRARPVITSLRLLAVLNVGFKNVGVGHALPEITGRRAPCTDGLIACFDRQVVRNAG